MAPQDIDFSAFESEPTEEQTRECCEAGEAGELGPSWSNPNGIGCEVILGLIIVGLAALFAYHWQWGASTVGIIIEVVILVLLLAFGAFIHFSDTPDVEASRVQLVQFAMDNDMSVWFGESEEEPPLAAKPAQATSLYLTNHVRFNWTMAGHEVRAAEYSFRDRTLNYLSRNRRYIAVRLDMDVPRFLCQRRDEYAIHAPTIKYDDDFYDWHTVTFDEDDGDPPLAVTCENGTSSRVRELITFDFLDELFQNKQARWIEADHEWIAIRLYDRLSSRAEWEAALAAIDLVISQIVDQR